MLAWIPDWLHTKHIGCDGYLLGSVLMAMFILIDIPGSNSSEKLDYVWEELQEGYRFLGDS